MFNSPISLGNTYLNYKSIFSNKEISRLMGNNQTNLEKFNFNH